MGHEKGYVTRKIIAVYSTENKNRERVEFECGHEQVIAPRIPRRKRMVCAECNGFPDAE